MLWFTLLKIFLLLLPFSFALNPSPGIDLPVVRILSPIIFLLWLADSLKQKKAFLDHRPRFWYLLFFIFLVALSFTWAVDPARSTRKIIFLLTFFPLYFVTFSASVQNQQEKIIQAITTGAIAIASLGIIQFFLQFILGLDTLLSLYAKIIAPFFLGESFSQVVVAYPSWLVNISGKTLLRAFATFPDPHLFSIYLNLCLPLTFFLYQKTKNQKYLAGFFIILLASLLSFSRSSYLGLLAAGIILLFKKNTLKEVKKKPHIMAAVIICGILLLGTNNSISKRLKDSFNVKEGSNSGRIEMWKKSIDTTLNYPLYGVGIGNFPRIVKPASTLREPIYAHNLFLDFSSETGVLSLLLLILLFLCPLFVSLQKPSPFNEAIALSVFILLVQCVFETPFYSTQVFPLIIVLLSLKDASPT